MFKDDEISGKMLNESWEVNDSRRHGQDKGVERRNRARLGSLCGQCHCAVVLRPTFQSSGEETRLSEVADTWLTFAF